MLVEQSGGEREPHYAYETLTMPSPCRDVKIAFLLGNALKDAWTGDPNAFKEKLSFERERLLVKPDKELNDAITDKKRLAAYEAATEWKLLRISLADCSIWPTMGKRPWAKGTVEEVTAKFLTLAKADDRLHEMAKIAPLGVFDELPLIVFKKKSGKGFRIDDGRHRALAYFLAREFFVSAFVGTVPAPHNHTWKFSAGGR